MLDARSHPLRIPVAAVLLAAGVGLSCSKSPTGPTPPPLHRTVAIRVADSLLVPSAGATVALVAQFDSAGLAPVVYETTDGLGMVSAVLVQGAWGAYALEGAGPRRAAGATFTVPGVERAAVDTVVVDLTLHAPAHASGRVLLDGRSTHAGTVVGCPPSLSVAVSDSSGSYRLDLLPLGTWTLTYYHPGFRLGTAPITMSTPGGAVQVPDVGLELLSGGMP